MKKLLLLICLVAPAIQAAPVPQPRTKVEGKDLKDKTFEFSFFEGRAGEFTFWGNGAYFHTIAGSEVTYYGYWRLDDNGRLVVDETTSQTRGDNWVTYIYYITLDGNEIVGVCNREYEGKEYWVAKVKYRLRGAK